ncbi:MAG: hypothetical protein DRP74_01220 [Candidatus Omnitrophota bacterium]|nr:MAG: hypothetical protein DRP74_01220 [Candidatus Omnitrophota bacterium]
MNILFLTNHLNIGGISKYVLELAGGLKQRGNNVYIASSGGRLTEEFQNSGIKFIPIPIRTKSELSFKILISFFKLLRIIKEEKIEILHANTRVTQVLSCLLSKILHIPYVSTCHGFFKTRLSRRLWPCWGRTVIAISEEVKHHLVRDFKLKEQEIKVVRHGIDLSKYCSPSTEYREETKKELGLDKGPVIGIIARLSQEKGHIYLIRAVKKAKEQVNNIRLIIIGEGRMREKLLTEVNSLGLEDSVIFFPSVFDTRKFLSVMDVFVLPSLKEGLGLSLMEAMTMSVPVIGTDIGGIKDLLMNQENGLMVKPGDSFALSQAILKIISDRTKAESLAKKAKQFIEKNFTKEKMIVSTEEVYSGCLNIRN